MRKRRRQRPGQWLPPLAHPYNQTGTGSGNELGASSSFLTLIVKDMQIAPNTLGINNITTTPLTIADNKDVLFGGTQSAVTNVFNAQNLADEQGLGYSLKRIVGQCICAVAPASNGQSLTPSCVAVTCGIMLRSVEPDTPDNPTAAQQGRDPQALENSTDPWIWRRTWVMSPGNAGSPQGPSSPAGSDDASQFGAVFQPSNTVFTGPTHHAAIDQKTRRTVKGEDRLFFHTACRCVGFDPTVDPGDVSIDFMCLFDYRLFGRVFAQAGGNRRNASR